MQRYTILVTCLRFGVPTIVKPSGRIEIHAEKFAAAIKHGLFNEAVSINTIDDDGLSPGDCIDGKYVLHGMTLDDIILLMNKLGTEEVGDIPRYISPNQRAIDQDWNTLVTTHDALKDIVLNYIEEELEWEFETGKLSRWDDRENWGLVSGINLITWFNNDIFCQRLNLSDIETELLPSNFLGFTKGYYQLALKEFDKAGYEVHYDENFDRLMKLQTNDFDGVVSRPKHREDSSERSINTSEDEMNFLVCRPNFYKNNIAKRFAEVFDNWPDSELRKELVESGLLDADGRN
jgi:hypothetical protein